MQRLLRGWKSFWLAFSFTLLAGSGCCDLRTCELPTPDVPRELDKVNYPTYVLETPDIILIDAIRLVPKPPYRIEPLDELFINLANPLAEPVMGIYPVDPAGVVNLGATYGAVTVADMTIEEAKKAIGDRLGKVIKGPVFEVTLARSRAMQQIRGEHLIRPDGTVGLGLYGSVH